MKAKINTIIQREGAIVTLDLDGTPIKMFIHSVGKVKVLTHYASGRRVADLNNPALRKAYPNAKRISSVQLAQAALNMLIMRHGSEYVLSTINNTEVLNS
jgi:hypothetical protein